MDEVLARLKKCRLWPGSLLAIAEEGGWLSETLLRQRAERARRTLDFDDCTPGEREIALAFGDYGKEVPVQ